MDQTRRYERVRNLASRMALAGADRVNGVWEAPWLPACDNPVEVRLSTPRTDRGRWTTSNRRPYDVSMLVPCRKCEQCLRIRQMQWRERIQQEMRAAAYNYFVTLTFSPAHLAAVLAESAKRRQNGRTAIEGAAYRHVSLYLKRLRKGRKATSRDNSQGSLGRVRQQFDPINLRFFAAMEYGEEKGRLHFHLCLHLARWTPAEVLTTEWRSRADADLVRSVDGCSTYLSKYLTKDQIPGRARASLRYGQESCTSLDVSQRRPSGRAKAGQQQGGEGEEGRIPPANSGAQGGTPPRDAFLPARNFNSSQEVGTLLKDQVS